MANIEVDPLTASDLSKLVQSAADEGVQFGYNVDVVAPPEFNDMMQNGFQAILAGDKTPEQQAADLQAAWEEGMAGKPRRRRRRNGIRGRGRARCPRRFTPAGMRTRMTGTTLDAPFIAPSISPARRSWRRYRAGILFVLPALILYLIFMVYPFFQSIYFSFTSWNGVTAVKEWVGLANYRELIERRPLLAFPATHRHLGDRRHDRADRHRHAAGDPPLAAAERVHPLPHVLLHAAGALGGRHRHRLELDLQPHLRHSQ